MWLNFPPRLSNSAVARPYLASNLLVVEGRAKVRVRIFGDDFRKTFDQRASRIGGQTADHIEGTFVPICCVCFVCSGGFHHARVVVWTFLECKECKST